MSDATNPNTTGIPAVVDPLSGTTAGTQSSLSTWAGDYVTDMLGKGQALSQMPYQEYQGQLVAGPSQLQTNAFSGVAGLTVPENMGAFTPQQFTADTASQYMNPYLQMSLDPQIAEAKRQAQIQQLQNNTALTKAGAYGGGRQAIMDSESNRNLLDNLANITGQGYNTAYQQALNQFNVEQGRQQTAQDAANQYGITALNTQASLGQQQRQMEQDALIADYEMFKEEQMYPYKQVQFQQSLLSGLPIESKSVTYNTPSQMSQLMSGAGGIMQLLTDAGLLGGSSTPTAEQEQTDQEGMTNG